MRLIDQYIVQNVVYGILLVLSGLSLLLAFMYLIDNLEQLGKANFGILELIIFITLSLPKKLYELFPAIILLGTTLGLSYLAAGSELTAMRAAGVSVGRIALAAMKAGLVFIVLAVMLGEWVVPYSEGIAQRGRAEALQISFHDKYSGLWLKDGQSFINIGEVLPDRSLRNITLYKFDHNRQLVQTLYGASARYKNKGWIMQDARFSLITAKDHQIKKIKVKKQATLAWDTVLTPENLAVFTVRPEGMSAFQLYQYIDHLKQNLQRTGRFELTFWNKVLMPLASFVMLLLAIPFVFTRDRASGIGQRLFIGIVIALAFNFLNLISGYTALIIGISPFFGAMTPILLFSGVAVWLFTRAA